MAPSDHTTLERVRLKRTKVEASTARLRLSYLLSSAALEPPAMPPSAILVVRAMEDPLPGRIAKALAPASLVSAEWEKAAQQSLGEFYRSAARPICGPVSSNARAVLFADRGEMLACLARDLASGASLGWWWQSILRRLASRLPGAWAAAWAAEPEYIPAALQYLDARQETVRILNRIAPAQAWSLLAAMLRAFHLPDSLWTRSAGGRAASAFAAAERPSAQRESSRASAPHQSADGADSLPRPLLRGGHGSAETGARFPWEPHVPLLSTPPEIGFERRVLLGMGLLLHRAPHIVCAPTFELRFRAWVRDEEYRSVAPEGSTRPSEVSNSANERNHDAGIRTSRPADRPGSTFPGSESSGRPGLPERNYGIDAAPVTSPGPPLHTPVRRDDRQAGDDLPGQPKPGQAAEPGRKSERVKATVPALDQPRPNPPERTSDHQVRKPISISTRDWAGGERTRAGGVLYLIHLLREAELLRKFRTGLSGWELIELLARCLLQGVPDLEEDAIWPALAGLAGRDPLTPAGSAFRPQETYAAPESWTQKAGASRFARFRSRGVEIWTAENFLVFDSPDAGGQAAARMTQSHRRRCRQTARVRPAGLSVSPELRRFLHFVMPYARWRLDRALCGAPIEGELLRTGKLCVTATNVDLIMPMKQISIPVRLAGLDANPGWTPSLGRIVKFHFVQGRF